MISLRRSALYVPGTNQRALDKITSLPTDMVILDLEDSVAPGMKSTARDNLARIINDGTTRGRETVLRINDRGSEFWQDDLAMLSCCAPHAVLIPKIANSGDMCRQVEELEHARPGIGIWLMMETPGCIMNASSIAACSDRYPDIQGFVVGTNDLAKDTSVNPGQDRKYLLPWLLQIVAAAKAFDLDVVDGVYNNFTDDSGFRKEATQGRDMGMTGKSLIHPRQIGPANEIFSPSVEDIEWARRVVDAFAREGAADSGVISLDGKMVERLHLDQARMVLARSKAMQSAR